MKKAKKTKAKSKPLSTFQREMQSASFKAAFDKEYQEFALQELNAYSSRTKTNKREDK